LVEKENGFISEEILFSGGSVNRGRSLKQAGPLPGQKSIRLAKKGCGSSNLDAGFRQPLATASLCGKKEEGTEQTSPDPYCPAKRGISFPGKKKTGLSDQRI
jgi:hypothetical protein